MRVLPLIMAIILSFAFVAGSFTEEAAAERPGAASLVRARVKQFIGTVVSVDMTAMTVTVKGMKAIMVIEADGAMLAGLRPGEKIRIMYTDEGGRHIAQGIEKAGKR